MEQRVSSLERETHTLTHRMTALEQRTSGIPERVSNIELLVSRMPALESQLKEQGAQSQRGFTMTNGILIGAGAFWAVFQAGPDVLRLLGGR